MASIIRDASLAQKGAQKIEWARRHMAVLNSIADEFEKTQPFKGMKAAVSVHLEAKTAYLDHNYYDYLAEKRPIGSRVDCDKPRHAGGAGCGKQRIQIGNCIAVCRTDRQSQQQAACNNNHQKT